MKTVTRLKHKRMCVIPPFAVSEKEMREIDRRAERAGMARATYIRERALGRGAR